MSTGKYSQFIFKDYRFDERAKTAQFTYAMDSDLEFTESYKFDFDFVTYNEKALDRALQNLFFMAGVSYYKMYVPNEIVVKKGKLDDDSAQFFSKTYQRGLGEFWYENDLDPNTKVDFPVNATKLQSSQSETHGLLVGVGGGKDSLVTIELIRNEFPNLATWSLNHRSQLTPLVERIGLPHLWVERKMDSQILELNKQGALNGHIPISAVFACVGTVVSILSGRRDHVVSNEQSANDPTLSYQGVEINHQYSKSQEFEEDYQALIKSHFGDSLRYYSLLRPLSEVRIAELFAKLGFEKYKDVFSSCNRAYTHDSDKMYWCGKCPKCAFVFLALSAFIPTEKLIPLWNGKNLLKDPELEITYEQLLGIAGDKPLECVGEVKENRAAMNLAQQGNLDLVHYHYDLPGDYDFRTHGSSSMPEEMLRLIVSKT